MAERDPFEYVVFRIVPDLDRAEFINAGVMVICRPRRFLAATTRLDRRRIEMLAPCLGENFLNEIELRLGKLTDIAAGERAGGPIAGLDLGERWHWLASPSSTIIQPSPVHTGITDDPEQELRQLFSELVELPDVGHS